MGWLKYSGYRGRNGARNVWGVVAGILVVLVVLMVLALLLGQRYLYYGADGVHLDLPFASSESEKPDVSQVVVEILPPAAGTSGALSEETDVSGEDVSPADEETPDEHSAPVAEENQTE